MEPSPSIKHPAGDDDGPPPKRVKSLSNEIPALYSESVKKKLASTSRTGQACDRCKERKMKCDTDPIACQPCRSKHLRCYTTDRVTGHPRERGQSDRTENELMYMQNQLQMYRQRYGPIEMDSRPLPSYPSTELASSSSAHTPSSRYVGWPAPHDTEPIERGPVFGTKVDIMDGIIDVANFDCDQMRDPGQEESNVFNASRQSILASIFHRQSVPPPEFPPKKEDALQLVELFLVIMSQYVPIVHRPSFRALVGQFYDNPDSVSPAELMQITIVLAIISQQSATRDHAKSEEEFRKGHHYLHYALGLYRHVYADASLQSMQALALLCVYFRNLPKPGLTWTFCNLILVRSIELQYHRDPNKVQLSPDQNNPLAKELRIRVFHSIMGICVTTGCRVGLPAPWQFQHVDVPLPTALKDDEISENGILTNRSGSCDFYPCLQLSRWMPLLTELYNHIISVRRPPADYLQTVEALNTKIIAWRQDWDNSVRNEPRSPPLDVATLLMDQWQAEFQLTLHHPVCCTSQSQEVMERHLEICHNAARRLLQSFHHLNQKYKAADFTWHSVITYAMAFGITLHVYRKKLSKVPKERFEGICNELSGWINLVAYADLVLRTGNLLQTWFRPRVQALEEDYRKLMMDSPTPQSSINPAFQPVNGVLPKPNVKSEPSPIPRQLNGVPSQQMPPPINSGYPTGPSSAASTPWAQSPSQQHMSYPTSSSHAQGYAPYQHDAAPQQTPPPPGSYSQQIPVSLAPLLNDPAHGIYASYPNPSQAQTQTVGPAMVDFGAMDFSPNHYYDTHNGAMSWGVLNMQGHGGQ